MKYRRQFADVVSVQGTLALENLGNGGVCDPRGVGNLSLKDSLGLDQMAEHFRVGDGGHGMRLALVLPDQVAENLQIISLLRGEVPPVHERIDHADRRIQFAVRTDGPQRKAENQVQVAVLALLAAADGPHHEPPFHVPEMAEHFRVGDGGRGVCLGPVGRRVCGPCPTRTGDLLGVNETF